MALGSTQEAADRHPTGWRHYEHVASEHRDNRWGIPESSPPQSVEPVHIQSGARRRESSSAVRSGVSPD